MNAWEVLGLEETGDERAIKRAYAKKLKLTRPEDDAEGFQLLRDAYEHALRMAAWTREQPASTVEETAAVQALSAPADELHPVGVAVFHDLNWQPTASAPGARDIAEHLWQEFLEGAAVMPRYRLKEIAALDAMLSFDVRDYFELCAIHFCSFDACDDELREAIAVHFRWDEDMTLVRRELPQEAAETEARLRAAQSYREYQAAAHHDKAVAALLADTPGRAFPRTWNRTFVSGMRDQLAALRWRHPEMLHFKLAEEVVDTWTRRVEGRYFFVQTLGWSLVGGFFLWAVIVAGLESYGLAKDNLGVAFLASVALSMAAGAGMERFTVFAAGQDWGERLVHHWRYQPLVQFGWIALLLVLGPSMLTLAPTSWLLLPVSLLALCCAFTACLANSVALNKWAFGMSMLFGGAVAYAATDVDYRFVAAWALTMSALQLFYRGGADLWAWLDTSDTWIVRMRVIWLAGTMVLLFAATQLALPLRPLVAVTMLWSLAGVLLSRPTVHFLYVMLAVFLLRAVTLTLLGKSSVLAQPALSPLLTVMLAVGTFMVVNMKRAKAHQQQFA